jgi:hypothetical protein
MIMSATYRSADVARVPEIDRSQRASTLASPRCRGVRATGRAQPVAQAGLRRREPVQSWTTGARYWAVVHRASLPAPLLVLAGRQQATTPKMAG